jgi:hypothetical protein
MHLKCIEPFGMSAPGDDMPDVPEGVALELIRAGKAVKYEPTTAVHDPAEAERIWPAIAEDGDDEPLPGDAADPDPGDAEKSVSSVHPKNKAVKRRAVTRKSDGH